MSLAQNEARSLDQFMAEYRARAKAKVAAATRPVVIRLAVAAEAKAADPEKPFLSEDDVKNKIRSFAADLGHAVIFDTPSLDGSGRPSLGLILESVSALTGCSTNEMISPRRQQRLVDARHIFYYCARDLTRFSLAAIGRFCNRDHSTIVNGLRVVERNASLLARAKTIISTLRETSGRVT